MSPYNLILKTIKVQFNKNNPTIFIIVGQIQLCNLSLCFASIRITGQNHISVHNLLFILFILAVLDIL